MAELRGICSTQRIVLYETKSRLYLVGSNNAETRFRVLKIDRTEPKKLVIIDDKVEYSQRQIKDLLSMINAGNITRNNKGYDGTSGGLHLSISAYGILGFVRFLEGYYIIVITERRKEAQIGGHTIYKIEDTQMIPIPNEIVRQKYQHPDEGKYVKIFQNVDLSSNFYFSYSYDLTLTLQQSMGPMLHVSQSVNECSCMRVWTNQKNNVSVSSSEERHDVHSSNVEASAEEIESSFSSAASYKSAQSEHIGNDPQSAPNKEKDFHCEAEKDKVTMKSIISPIEPETVKSGSSLSSIHDKNIESCMECQKKRKQNLASSRGGRNKNRLCYKFVWNKYLLKHFEDVVHPDWVLHIINGFVGQSDICIYMRPIYVTLIARRSAEFAGTRFLKRGANDQGYVANEVETEQIVHDASVISLCSGWFTSYVQLRGSVPSFWSQDVNKGIVPKPQIMVDRADPFCMAASQHFNQLLKRYGAPVVILNLVKKKEKRRHEQILSEELQKIVEYLNQFLPPDMGITYIGWDMSRTNKSKGLSVIEKLTGIADEVFKMTGFFHSGQELYCNKLRKHSGCEGMRGTGYCEQNKGRKQNGVLRVNCVDCLDRTNTAQFMAGKCALGFQLYTLGVIDKPVVEFDSDVVRILEDLYEAHGDTIALQYGGSQLVHGIRTYRKVSPFTSHSRDIMQTVSRYYSNAFTDADKQQAMNLFLGVFVPDDGKPRLWELPTDYYLHHNTTSNVKALKNATSYTKWCSPQVVKSLPHSVCEDDDADVTNHETSVQEFTKEQNSDDEESDVFSEYYRPYELSTFDRLHAHVMQKSCRDFRPNNTADPSPFVVRAPRKTPSRRPVSVRKAVGAAPSMAADDSSDSDDTSDDESMLAHSTRTVSDDSSNTVSFQDLLPSMKDTYGVGLREPRNQILQEYERFIRFLNVSQTVDRDEEREASRDNVDIWKVHRPFSYDSCRQVKPPSVERRARALYGAYLQSLVHHAITAESVSMYRSYVSKQWRS